MVSGRLTLLFRWSWLACSDRATLSAIRSTLSGARQQPTSSSEN